MSRVVSAAAIFFMAFLTQGCAVLNSPLKPALPELPATIMAAPESPGIRITATLLELVDDAMAKAYVNEAIKNNYDLRATALRLSASGLLLSRTAAAKLPGVDAGYAMSKSHIADGTGTENRHRVSLSLNWELDLWGKLADRHGARELNFQAMELAYQRAMDSLAARVLQSYFNVKANKLQLAIHEKRVNIYQSIEKTILIKYQAGLGTLDDISAVKTKTNIAKAGMEGALDAYSSAVREFEILLGRYPGMAIEFSENLPDVSLPPASVPASILEHRPDIQAALSKFNSARKDAGASHKERLPGITISADIFRDNKQLGKLGATGSSWSLAGNLLYPVFNAGKLKNEAKAADAEAKAAYMDFSMTVLQAMKEAENTFSKEKYLNARLAHLERAIKHAKTSSQYYESRYRKGLADIVELHTARDQELDVMADIIDVKASRIINRVDMALALGTGVFKRGDK